MFSCFRQLTRKSKKDLEKDNTKESKKESEEASDEAPDDAVKLIRSKLPEYIQECLLVSGFDTLDTIASMNNDCDKFVDQVEQFIQENFPGNSLYCNPHSTTCKFPPGHRIRIRQFVTEVKSLVENRKRKQECVVENLEKVS